MKSVAKILRCDLDSTFPASRFAFFFFLAVNVDFSMNSVSVHCLRDPQTSFFNNFFIKNKSHGTIHTFKNYFATVFSVFNFQFSTVSKQTLKISALV